MADSPHVVLITCHDLGRHLGCYGVQTVQSPHIDAIAFGGVRFEHAYCVSPGCSPSRSTLATGRYPHTNGVMGLTHGRFSWDLGWEEQHAAQIFGTHGYETHLFGLQHVSPAPERLGFAHVHDQGLGPEVAADVAAFLAGTSPETPMYIEVNLFEPHRPYDRGGVAPDTERGVWVPPYLPQTEEARSEMAALQGAVRQADAAVGQIAAALDRAGIADDTLLVFTADHGIAMPRAKCTLYDPGIGVVLLARWPAAGIDGGRTVSQLVSNVDFLPSLLDAAGIPAPGGMQGRSFLPLLRGEAYDPRDAVYAEKTYHSYYDPMRAIRTARYKYIRNFESAFLVEIPGDIADGAIFRSDTQRYHGATHPATELYDLQADPDEQQNLAGDPAYAEVEHELDAHLRAWMRETEDPLLLGPVPSPAYRQCVASQG